MTFREVKALAIKEIIQRAQLNSRNDQQRIRDFLKECPEESNYLIENFIIGNSRVAEPISFRKSTQTFAKHISLDKLNDNCHLKLSQEQFNWLTSFQV